MHPFLNQQNHLCSALAQLPHLLSKNTSKLGSKKREVVDNIMFYFNICFPLLLKAGCTGQGILACFLFFFLCERFPQFRFFDYLYNFLCSHIYISSLSYFLNLFLVRHTPIIPAPTRRKVEGSGTGATCLTFTIRSL